MARIRSVSPELRQSETAASWPRETRYAWVLLWGYCDDYGRGLDNPKIIAADCFPLDDDVDPDVMAGWMDVFEKAGSICRYEQDGKRWFHCLSWSEYQKPQHPGKVRIPPCATHESAAHGKWLAEHGRSSGGTHEDYRSASPTSKEGELGVRSRRGRQSGGKPVRAPRCDRHSSMKNPPPCGECKELRLRHEATETLDRPALSVVPADLRCPTHGELAGACTGCAAARRRGA